MNNKNNKKTISIFTWLLIIVLVCAFWPTNSIAKIIEKDNNFKYSTSITSHFSNSDRAHVYAVDMSVPEAARYISEQKRPYSHTDYNNEQSIQLDYDDHYINIYKGENSITYIQVSSKKYVHYNGYSGLYRPLNRNIIVFFDRTYSNYSKSNNSRYGKGYTNYDTTDTFNTYNYDSNSKNTKSSTSSSTTTKNSKNNNTTTNNKSSSNKIKTNNQDSSKIRTNNQNSSKIRTNSQNSNKINTKSKPTTKSSTKSSKSFFSRSARSSSVGSRSRLGGGISFGK